VIPTCYRHADRETRLACSSCGRPVCVECVQSAAVGQRCPECATGDVPPPPPPVVPGRDLRRRTRRSTPVTTAVMAICIGVWVLAFVAPDLGNALYAYGAQANGRIAQLGEWYRLLTAAFLHSPVGFTHILFNMYALYVFGPQLERDVGSAPFAALYLSSAVTGGAVFYFFGSDIAVGASGAIFGLFGAWIAAALRNRRSPAGRAGLRQLLVLLAINTALPLLIPNIAWQAHMGGLAAGFLIALAWSTPALGRSSATRTLVAAAVGIASLALVIAG